MEVGRERSGWKGVRVREVENRVRFGKLGKQVMRVAEEIRKGKGDLRYSIHTLSGYKSLFCWHLVLTLTSFESFVASDKDPYSYRRMSIHCCSFFPIRM